MEKTPLYSIGHGTRKSADLIALLKQYKVEYLVDVRSRPYSRFNPQFNQGVLQRTLAQQGIRYVFMGDALGGRPEDVSCYNNKGKISYDIVQTKDFFKKGIERLRTAYRNNIPVAIMCSESKPGRCHRSKLIGNALAAENIILQHIDEYGLLKDQHTVIDEIRKETPATGLFDRL